MNIPDGQIKDGISAALSGAILYDGEPVGVSASIAPPDARFPRILIQGISTNISGGKCQNLYNTILSLQITYRSKLVADEGVVDTIADNVINTLCPDGRTPFFTVSGYYVHVFQLTGSSSSVSNFDGYIYTTKTIRLTLKTEKI